MAHLPAVISAEGCFAWRNYHPYSTEKNYLFLLGNSDNPLQIFVLHLLYSLHRKIPCFSDMDGIKPNLDAYIQQMEAPIFKDALFQATNINI